jgi:DNA-directed RNA polymerase subunit F
MPPSLPLPFFGPIALLSQHTQSANRYLKNVPNVSSEVAESLLKHLIKSSKLNASTLRKLADHW